MQKRRWYSAAEPLGDGTIVLIGGFTNGGYINRNWPNTDPEFEGGAADCTYEYYPNIETAMDCVIKTEFVCAHGVWRGAGARRLARWRGGTRSPIAIDCITARRPTPRAPCSQPPSSSPCSVPAAVMLTPLPPLHVPTYLPQRPFGNCRIARFSRGPELHLPFARRERSERVSSAIFALRLPYFGSHSTTDSPPSSSLPLLPLPPPPPSLPPLWAGEGGGGEGQHSSEGETTYRCPRAPRSLSALARPLSRPRRGEGELSVQASLPRVVCTLSASKALGSDDG